MNADEIREFENTEIEARLGELREELFRLRFRSATMELENPMIIRAIRKDIGRLKTILRERELAEQTD